MNKKNIDTVNENEEYHLPDENDVVSSYEETENVEHTQNEDGTAENNQSAAKEILLQIKNKITANKKIAIISFLFIFALVFFQFSNKSTDSSAKQVTNKIANQEASSQNKIALVSDQLTQLQTANAKNQQEIAALKSTINNLSSSVNQLNASRDDANDQIEAVNKKLDLISSELSKLNSKQDIKSKLVKKPTITYTLKASVPGRAWVQHKNQVISVTIGDKLKQYGVVTSIDSDAGIVKTSSGRTIAYGQNDF